MQAAEYKSKVHKLEVSNEEQRRLESSAARDIKDVEVMLRGEEDTCGWHHMRLGRPITANGTAFIKRRALHLATALTNHMTDGHSTL